MGYDYNSWEPVKIKTEDLTDSETQLLRDSDTFCIYPWIHLHTYPTGETYPCCHAEMDFPVGSAKENTLEEIWGGREMKALRKNMLNGVKADVCKRCYEQDAAGFFSGRKSANKHHGHHIKKVINNFLPKFEMSYWDIRFSNLCNLSCRTCGHIFSSSWFKDQIALAGPRYAEENNALNVAGRFDTDMIEQLLEHIPYVEQIYFAGGEPLMMEEHYIILDELERLGKFDVRLIYNSNFTVTKLKNREVFDYWKKFESVSVGASLDAMGKRAEYIRKGTKWNVVEENRRKMLEICPNVDFYISPTYSIFNALHLFEFHKNWVEKGLLKPQDLNINILQDPKHYRIDIASAEYKDMIRDVINLHLKWLESVGDPLQRATNGLKSALNFLDVTDNSHLIETFWQKTHQLDGIRNESIIDYIPELGDL